MDLVLMGPPGVGKPFSTFHLPGRRPIIVRRLRADNRDAMLAFGAALPKDDWVVRDDHRRGGIGGAPAGAVDCFGIPRNLVVLGHHLASEAP